MQVDVECPQCGGCVEHDDLSNAAVCVDCGATSGEVHLIQHQQFDSSGVLQGRRIEATVSSDDPALERRVRIFVDAAFDIAHKIGDTAISLRTELTTLARRTIPQYNRPPRGRQIYYAGAAAVLLRARRMDRPVSLGDVARAAGISTSKLNSAYNLLTKAIGATTPTPCSIGGYLERYQFVADRLLPDVNDAWRHVRATACVALRVAERLWTCQGRAPALHCAVAVAFALRAVACEELASFIPNITQCANALAELGGVSRSTIMTEYKRIADAMVQILGDKDEVHTRLDEVASKLESSDNRSYQVARKRSRGASMRQLAEDGDSDDSEVERAVLTDAQVVKRARIIERLSV